MRQFSSEQSVDYNILDKDYNILESLENEACYSELEDILDHKRSDEDLYVELINIECEETKQYSEFYCNYIGKILKLEYKYELDSFIFKDTKSKKINLLVGTLIRYLWEGSRLSNQIKLFENLYNNKDILEYSLEEFCYFYRKLSDGYISRGHQIYKPSKVLIKSYNDLILALENDFYRGDFIDNFFTKKHK